MINSLPSYNLTVMAIDQGGLSGLTFLNVYLNKTSLIRFDQTLSSSSSSSSFRCSILGLKAELNQSDMRTLEPKLFIVVSYI